MPLTKHIDWTISASDILTHPLGYRLSFSDDIYFNAASSVHNSFERTAEFLYSPTGKESDLVPYPVTGLLSPAEGMLVRMMVHGEDPDGGLVVHDGGLLKIGSGGLACGSRPPFAFAANYVATDCRTNETWVLDENGGVNVYSPVLSPARSFRVDSSAVAVVPDGARGSFWEILPDEIVLRSMSDLSVLSRKTIGYLVWRIFSACIIPNTGDLFVAWMSDVYGDSIARFGRDGTYGGAAGIVLGCGEWGPTGALVAMASPVIRLFDGTGLTTAYDLSAAGITAYRISSCGGRDFYVLDRLTRKMHKIAEASGAVLWSKKLPATADIDHLDIGAAFDHEAYGRTIYFWSSDVAGAYRDMVVEAWPCGAHTALADGTGMGAVMHTYAASHAWVKIEAVDHSDGPVRESSSSHSSSSTSSQTASASSMSTATSTSHLVSFSSSSQSESSSSQTQTTSSTHLMSSSSSPSWSEKYMPVDNYMVTASDYVAPHYPWVSFDYIWEVCEQPLSTSHAWVIDYGSDYHGRDIDEWVQVDFGTPKVVQHYILFGNGNARSQYTSSESSSKSSLTSSSSSYTPSSASSTSSQTREHSSSSSSFDDYPNHVYFEMSYWITESKAGRYPPFAGIEGVFVKQEGVYFNGMPVYRKKGWIPQECDSSEDDPTTRRAVMFELRYDGWRWRIYDSSGVWQLACVAPSQVLLNSYWEGGEVPWPCIYGYMYSGTGYGDCQNVVQNPSDWKLLGSDDGSSWTQIDAVAGAAYEYDYDETLDYNGFAVRRKDVNLTAYRYYKMTFSKKVGTGRYFSVARIRFVEA